MRRKSTFITSPSSPQRRMDDLVSVVLLSEKSGYRMKSYGPTPLLKVGGQCLLDIQISAIKSVFSNFEIIVCCGFDSEKVIRYIRKTYPDTRVRVVENQIYQHSNCCESLRLCLNNINNSRVLVSNGSLMLDPDILSSIDPSQTHVVSALEGSRNLDVGFTANANGLIQNFSYGINNVWSEMLYLNSAKAIETLREILSLIDFKNRFLFEALNRFIRGVEISVIPYTEKKLVNVNNIKTYHMIRRYYEGTSTKLHD